MTFKYIILLCSFSCLVKAQTQEYEAYWAFSLHIGPSISGVPINLTNKLEEHAFRRWSGGLFVPTSTNAQQMTKENPVFQAKFERVSRNALSYQLLLSMLSGNVRGFSQNYGEIHLNYLQFASSFLIGYHSKQRITRIAAGPSLHYTSVKTAELSSAQESASTGTKPGFAIETGFRFPAKKTFFLDFTIQYQYVGRADLGTYRFGPGKEVFIGEKPSSYVCFNLGIGLRFLKF